MRWQRLAPLILLIIASLTIAVVIAEPTYTPLKTHTYSDDSINSTMVYDGANYIYVTPYGNYTWLQPGNILSFTDHNGIETIEKSVFITQYNSTGSWLPLLDFYDKTLGDPVVTVANETYYRWDYNVYDKKEPIGVGYLAFNTATGLPKITVEFTRNENWQHGSYRWIWDIVPYTDVSGNGFTHYYNQSSGEIVDIQDLTGLQELYTSHPNTTAGETWEEVNYQRKIKILDNESRNFAGILDVSSYNATIWYGGDEPNWNSKGFVTIFPVNESLIDPITYTEETPNTILVGNDGSGWDEINLTAQSGVPFNSLVEIMGCNFQTVNNLYLGARQIGSSLSRLILLNEAEDGGETVSRFLVNVNASGYAELHDGGSNGFFVRYRVVGYWEDLTFTEQWVTYQVGAAEDDMWHETDGSELSLMVNTTHLITITNDDAGKNFWGGVRNTTSSLDRRLNIMEAEGGGNQTTSMFVQADGSKKIDVYSEQDNDIWFINQGYFDNSSISYVENWVQISPGVSGSWEKEDLSAHLDEDGRIVDTIIANIEANTENQKGIRTGGSALSRYIDLREAEGDGNSSYGVCTLTNSTGHVELYAEDNANEYFVFLGYFVPVSGVTNFERSVTQALGLAVDATRLVVYGRDDTLGITLSNDATRVVFFPRASTLAVSYALSTVRSYSGVRDITQSLTLNNDATREADYQRASTQALGLAVDAASIKGMSRAATQAIGFVVDAIRDFDMQRTASQALGIAIDGDRLVEYGRTSTQTIGFAVDAVRVKGIVRTISQGITLVVDAVRSYVGSRSATQSIGFTVDADRVVGFTRNLSQSIGFAVDAASVKGLYRAATQGITFVVDAVRVQGHLRSLSQSLGLAVDAVREVDYGRLATQALGIVVDADRIKGMTRAITQGISFTVDAVRSLGYLRSPSQAIGLVVDAVATLTEAAEEFIRNVTLSLSLANDATRTTVLGRAITQGISFTVDAVSDFSGDITEFVRNVTLSITATINTARSYQGERGATLLLDIFVRGIEGDGITPTTTTSVTLIFILPIIMMGFIIYALSRYND